MIVTPAYAGNTETEVLVACGTPKGGFPLVVGHLSVCGCQVFLQILVVLGATNHAEVVARTRSGWFCTTPCKRRRSDYWARASHRWTAVVTDELQAEFIYEHVEGAKAVASMGVGSVGIHDYVGIVCGPNKELHEEPVRLAAVGSRLANVQSGHYCPPLPTRGKVRVPGEQNIHAKLCEKSHELINLINHKLWHGQLCQPVPHEPVHSGRSSLVVIVAQKVDGLAVLPGDVTHTSQAPEFIPATFGQPLAEFLEVVLLAWHDGTRCQDSQFLLQQVEECDEVVKMVHEQHVILVDDLRVLHTAD